MFLLCSFVLIAIALLLLYCSNKHQKLLSHTLSKKVRKLAYVLLCVAIGAAFLSLNGAAAFFFWLMMLMILFALIPFSIFFIKGNKSE